MIVSAKNSPTASWTPSSTRKAFELCTSCEGARLNPVARNVRFREQGIHAVVAHSVIDVERFVNALKLCRARKLRATSPVEVKSRLAFLQEVGSAISRWTARRRRSLAARRSAFAAAQLGSNLRGVAYVLDEPTIGLRATTASLLDTLEKLQAKGNTLVVVEHDGTPSNARTTSSTSGRRGRARRRDCCRGNRCGAEGEPEVDHWQISEAADRASAACHHPPLVGEGKGGPCANAHWQASPLPSPPHRGGGQLTLARRFTT